MSLDQESALVQLRKGVLEYCVLAQLKRAPSYGLQLAADLARFRTLFSSEGTIYPLLARLRKLGYVETSWQESTTGPPRRMYTITSPGDHALSEFTKAWGPFINEATRSLTGKN